MKNDYDNSDGSSNIGKANYLPEKLDVGVKHSDQYLEFRNDYIIMRKKTVDEATKIMGIGNPEVKQFIINSDKFLDSMDSFYMKGKEVVGGLFDAGILNQTLQLAENEMYNTHKIIVAVGNTHTKSGKDNTEIVKSIKDILAEQTISENILIQSTFNHSFRHAITKNFLNLKPSKDGLEDDIYRH